MPPLQAHLVLTFGISPTMRMYFFPFCQQKKITLLPALSIMEISPHDAIIKAQMRELVLRVMLVLGGNQRRCLINQALDSSQSQPHPVPTCQRRGQLLTCVRAPLPGLAASELRACGRALLRGSSPGRVRGPQEMGPETQAHLGKEALPGTHGSKIAAPSPASPLSALILCTVVTIV